ncbi:MAG: ankyrin repeat domain-containing protein [Vicinamibacterales bacterium]
MKWVSTVRMRQGLGWLGVVAVLAVLRPAVPSAQSPISTAAKAGDRAAVRRLVAGGANVNTPASDGSTALLWAVYNSDIEMVRSLIAAGAKVDAANRYGMTPLLQASRTGDMPIMEALLKAGASSKLTHEDGETPLMAAARAGRVDAVRLLLARGADVNGTDALQDQTPLMWAAGEGHAEVVSALLEAGAKPNLQARKTALTVRSHADHPSGGFTALMWAARNGHEDTVRTLAKAGADLNAKNGDNASATIIAIANDRLDMANLLLDLGADPNDGALYFAVDQHDGTTDMRAKDGGLLRWDHPNKVTTMDLIKRLLAMGADPNKAFQGQLHSISMANPDNHNASAFYRAAVAADVEALKVILPKADLKWMPSAPPAGGRGGNLGRSAVMAASVGGRGASFGGGPGFGRIDKPVWREAGSRTPAEAVELLIKAGADANFQLEDDGNTALHQAVTRNDLDMIKVLARNGASMELYNWAGQTPIAIAEDAWETEKKRVGPPPEVLQAMNAGTPIPEVKSAKNTIVLMRELMGWPAWADTQFGKPAFEVPTAAKAPAGGQ